MDTPSGSRRTMFCERINHKQFKKRGPTSAGSRKWREGRKKPELMGIDKHRTSSHEVYAFFQHERKHEKKGRKRVR